MNAAEELFATYGIDAVSNRKITEHAGTANHSAINYHFGGRDELMRALLTRHVEKMSIRRAELVAALGQEPALRDVVACRILPWVEQLEVLPRPSWRARFLYQVRRVPSVAAVLADTAAANDGFEEMLLHLRADLGQIPPTVLRARAGILGHMVLGICSEFEARIQEGTEQGSWVSVGYFLVDAIAGMLAAPVTHPVDFMAPPASTGLL